MITPMVLRQELCDSAVFQTSSAHGVAVDQCDRAALAPIAAVQLRTVHFHEGAFRQVPAFRPAAREVVANREGPGSLSQRERPW